MHAVAMDYFHGLQTAYAGLRGLGYCRIGLILQEELEARTGHLWLGAYRSIQQPTMKPFLFRDTPDLERGLRQWLRTERPDAVLTIHREWHEKLACTGIALPAYLNDFAPYPGAPLIQLDPRHIGRESVQLNICFCRGELGLPDLPNDSRGVGCAELECGHLCGTALMALTATKNSVNLENLVIP